MRRTTFSALLAVAALAVPMAAQAEVRITEFMYQGANSGNREFFEITNLGDTAVNINGWSYNDSDPDDAVLFGNFFGDLAAHESVVFTEMTAAAFRTYWGLDASVRVFSIGGDSNLGSSDTINIYSSSVQTLANLVDSVSYSGTTRGISRNRPVGVTGTVTNAQFANSAVNDVYGSHLAPTSPADLGNPGSFPAPTTTAVPEPASWALMIAGIGMVGAINRRRGRIAFA